MNQLKDIKMSRSEQRQYNRAKVQTLQRESFKRTKYAHTFLCECRRCEPGIITKWRKVKV